MKPLRKILLCSAALLALLSGCGKAQDAQRPSEPEQTLTIELPDQRRLHLAAAEEQGAEFTRIFPAQAGSSFKTRIHYVDVTDVRIEVDGKVWYLKNALEEGAISLEEMAYAAKLDAQNGFCQAYARVRGGVAFVGYRYPEYDLRFLDGAENTYNAQQHPTHELYILSNPYELRYIADYAREDWGLSFETVEANETSVTFDCTQRDGEQLGMLIADFCYLFPAQGEEELTKKPGTDSTSVFQPKPELNRDTVTRVTLDWSDIYGPLPAGDYRMRLMVSDVYRPNDENTQVSHLFKKTQGYDILFTVP